ncbi:hypothetical protein GA0061094_0537 [[Bacillus] enclensis]|uniref:Uncharacterized protein n=1 Tax=[Bacillus] enclensis TaxID=1402860 RepID=A0A1C3ZAL5_9BACI|nr:hypothetical protein GA0061094_0537 [[Bacillus] enclensis]
MKGCGGYLLFTSQLIKYGTKGLVVYGKINTVEKTCLEQYQILICTEEIYEGMK